jgi:hypothetical protein
MAGIPWSEKEREVLKKLAEAHCIIDDVLRVFPSRSRASIFSQASVLGISFAGPESEINMDEFKKLVRGK